MSAIYQSYALNWEGIALSVRFAPQWTSGAYEIGHIEIESADRVKLPVTETGYRSHFVHKEDVHDAGGPDAYVKAWLDHEAASPDWKRYVQESKQLSLF